MIIEIKKPSKYIDGALFYKETKFNYFQENDKFYLSGEATEKQLLDALETHNPPAPEDLIAAHQALLTKLGITEEEAQLLLGGN